MRAGLFICNVLLNLIKEVMNNLVDKEKVRYFLNIMICKQKSFQTLIL